ncbi:MAG TPA: PilZ domain-containing protein, partial [Spirochaetia bacterium]|nr:PilZ domain-containing protein [Spirochaetia bacterium]
AKGRRHFVRARCSDPRKASFNVTVRNTHLTGTIVDISVAGMSFRLDKTVHLRPHELFEDLQLRLRGTLCRLSGMLAGAVRGDSDRQLLLFKTPLTGEVRAKIHRFIFLSLQEEMDEFVRTLKT